MKLICATDERFGVNSYLIEENRHCILIDPVQSDALMKGIADLTIDFAILTHEHYDHISGVNDFKQKFRTRILCGEKAAERLKDPGLNLSRFQDYIVQMIPFGNGQTSSEEYSCTADQTLADNQVIRWEGHSLFFKETPGHSAGSISILLDTEILFSGDTIFRDYPTATRLPGGSTKQFRTITEPWLDSLSQDIRVLPGHGEAFLLRERQKN